ncbi:MAG: ribosome biogenesis GTPase YlqF [Clostridia bacterium]|nr:ribosome biogenesis GTPase YlqF [Clostridia bacterium]
MCNEANVIQWFPGHMAKTRRKITESLSLVDAVVEITDARIPVSSRNPELAGIVVNKPLIVLLNKCDMADPNETQKWVKKFAEQGITALPMDCRSGKGVNAFPAAVKQLLKDKIEHNKAKGMVGKSLRLMVVGIPNVGKSSFINRLTKSGKAKVEDRPGVTRSNQWFKVDNGLELLDTPGVLWPKFDDPRVGLRLACTGAVKDTVMDIETLAVNFISEIKNRYGHLLEQRYKFTLEKDADSYDILCEIGRKRGMVIRGGEIDTERAAVMLMDEYRAGTIGKTTLDTANEMGEQNA